MRKETFGNLYSIPSRNGINRPSSSRGAGFKMINMGELFANDRIYDIEMELVQLNAKEKENFEVKPNDLLFARQSIVAEGAGKCSIVLQVGKETTCFESHIIRVRLNEKLAHPLFYYYFFQSNIGKGYLSSIRQQGVQAGIRGSELALLKIPYLDLPTQRKIAAILSAYDDLIENNLKRIKLLEEKAQLTYEEWFVRMKFPGNESTPINIETGLPEGWKKKTLGDLTETMQYGYTASASDEVVGPKFLRITDIVSENINWENVPYCPIDQKNKEKYLLKEGDIVIARTGATVGYGKRINKNCPDAVFASYLIRLKLKTDIDDLVMGVFVESPSFVKIVQNMAGGAAQPNANAPILKQIEMICPEKSVQKKFRDLVIKLKDSQQTLLEQNQLLKEARDILLPRLMSGIIDVEGVEVKLEELETK
jgi:type I restriction enzyme S subunit